MKNKIKVIYICSQGHSGSTLINNILSGNKNCFSLGEIKELKKRLQWFKENNQTKYFFCDCKKRLDECPFWKETIKNLDYKNLQEQHMPLIKKTIKLITNKPDKKIIKEEEKLLKKCLINAKKTKSKEVNVLIDSSKDLKRLKLLTNMPTIDLYTIHLIRDGRGVINSHEKTGFNWLRTYILWLIQILITKTILINKNKLTISYDFFAKNPDKQIKKICAFLNLTFEKNYLKQANKEKSHVFAGNIMRFKKIESIKYDEKWRREMPKWKQTLLTILCYIPNKLWVYNKKLE